MRTSKQPVGRKRARTQANVMRAVADELGITTPKRAKRPRRKGPMRVAVYKAGK